MKPETGDKVRVTKKDGTTEGTLMPSVSEDIKVIKLENGYNIGIDKKNIEKIDVLEKKEHKTPKEHKLKNNPDLPTIAVLHTGGTIASKVDYSSGAVIAAFSADDLIHMFPEIQNIANIKTKIVAQLMSEEMRFSHYKLIAKAVQEEIKTGVKGIIIGHGTDTMGYSAAALSFMLENLPIPVILVGAQRSTDRGSTDAKANLLSAAHFITKTDYKGVAICMHSTSDDKTCNILPGTKTKKLHTSKRDAFKSVNSSSIANIDYLTGEITYLSDYNKKINDELIIKDAFEEKVGLLKTYPNIDNDIFEFYTEKGYKGLVIEGTGLGHVPAFIDENSKNFESLKRFIKNGGIIVMTSQCMNGRVHPNVYTPLRKLSEAGIIYAEDMLAETAYIKLSWLLGNYSKEEAKELMTKNLRGEISERSLYEE